LSLRLRRIWINCQTVWLNWLKKTRRLQLRLDEQTGQTVISGMGELHLDIIIDRLKREFKVECNQGKPQVNYKEAITKTVTCVKFIRDSLVVVVSLPISS